mmetsp:Transcript_24098/g.81364  ORF Transcript_24098/g.81364 Transcript_24098/m.81364 type:complete len:281 (-) Transcript_24098:572-1414(-)
MGLHQGLAVGRLARVLHRSARADEDQPPRLHSDPRPHHDPRLVPGFVVCRQDSAGASHQVLGARCWPPQGPLGGHQLSGHAQRAQGLHQRRKQPEVHPQGSLRLPGFGDYDAHGGRVSLELALQGEDCRGHAVAAEGRQAGRPPLLPLQRPRLPDDRQHRLRAQRHERLHLPAGLRQAVARAHHPGHGAPPARLQRAARPRETGLPLRLLPLRHRGEPRVQARIRGRPQRDVAAELRRHALPRAARPRRDPFASVGRPRLRLRPALGDEAGVGFPEGGRR